jgi:hypothetical protein
MFTDCGQLEEVSMWFPSGCYNKAQIWLKERIHLVGIIGFVVGVIQVKIVRILLIHWQKLII